MCTVEDLVSPLHDPPYPGLNHPNRGTSNKKKKDPTPIAITVPTRELQILSTSTTPTTDIEVSKMESALRVAFTGIQQSMKNTSELYAKHEAALQKQFQEELRTAQAAQELSDSQQNTKLQIRNFELAVENERLREKIAELEGRGHLYPHKSRAEIDTENRLSMQDRDSIYSLQIENILEKSKVQHERTRMCIKDMMARPEIQLNLDFELETNSGSGSGSGSNSSLDLDLDGDERTLIQDSGIDSTYSDWLDGIITFDSIYGN